jgi:hypothetical protein
VSRGSPTSRFTRTELGAAYCPRRVACLPRRVNRTGSSPEGARSRGGVPTSLRHHTPCSRSPGSALAPASVTLLHRHSEGPAPKLPLSTPERLAVNPRADARGAPSGWTAHTADSSRGHQAALDSAGRHRGSRSPVARGMSLRSSGEARRCDRCRPAVAAQLPSTEQAAPSGAGRQGIGRRRRHSRAVGAAGTRPWPGRCRTTAVSLRRSRTWWNRSRARAAPASLGQVPGRGVAR